MVLKGRCEPEVSVIICTYKRSECLINVMKSMDNQNFDKSMFEVIVVNNNSPDNTEEVYFKNLKLFPETCFRYFVEMSPGLSAARNRGIQESRGKIISFIDDDAVALNTFCSEVYKSFNSDNSMDALGGKVIPLFPENRKPSWLSSPLEGTLSIVDYGDTEKVFPKKKFPVGCNMSFRRRIFKELGVFSTDLLKRSDEKFVFNKLKAANKKIWYNPKVFVYHDLLPERYTLSGILKIAREIGSSERVRTSNKGLWYLISKFFEYLIKVTGGMLLSMFYFLTGRRAKAYYLWRFSNSIIYGFLFHTIKK